MSKDRPFTRPVVVLLYALTFTTGIVDAVTLLGLGDIFASLMTGNVVYIGMGLAGSADVSPLRSGFAILCFIAGAFVAGVIAVRCAKIQVGRWLLMVGMLESALILLAALFARLIGPEGPVSGFDTPVLGAIALTSMAMGIRNSTVLRLPVADLKVTVLTLTISGLGADLGSGTSQAEKQLKRLISILLIGLGALTGAGLFFKFGVATPLILVAAITLTATFLFSRTRDAKTDLDGMK